MEDQRYQKDIESIRELMERSVKFISLSGMSGILSGVYALMGAAAANYVLGHRDSRFFYNDVGPDVDAIRFELLVIAAVVLIASVGTGYWLTSRKSKRVGAKIWDAAGRRFLINLSVPLITGGVFILLLLNQGYEGLVASSCLIFYGLALLNASSSAFEEVRYLGYCEIVVGLAAAGFPGYGLSFWAFGFGVLHILYGAIMYKKYDR